MARIQTDESSPCWCRRLHFKKSKFGEVGAFSGSNSNSHTTNVHTTGHLTPTEFFSLASNAGLAPFPSLSPVVLPNEASLEGVEVAEATLIARSKGAEQRKEFHLIRSKCKVGGWNKQGGGAGT